MPWLVVLGAGSWRYDRVQYKPGAHEVSEEVATAARRAPSRRLVIMAEEPILAHSEGPLTMEDLRRGAVGVQLERPSEVHPSTEPRELDVVYDFGCQWCPRSFPSRGMLDRHIEFHHAVTHGTDG